jgi:hypothetical protein
VKFWVVDRWSINRPGVAIRISTFDEPPSSLLVSLHLISLRDLLGLHIVYELSLFVLERVLSAHHADLGLADYRRYA